MNFGEALVALKNGGMVMRASWKETPFDEEQHHLVVNAWSGADGGPVPQEIGLIAPNGVVDSWKPDSSDMLADDWEIVPLLEARERWEKNREKEKTSAERTRNEGTQDLGRPGAAGAGGDTRAPRTPKMALGGVGLGAADRAVLARAQRAMTEQEQEFFRVMPEHIALMRKMYVGWQDCETGAPEIDPKRPYGNSSVYRDIAEILHAAGFEGWAPPNEDEMSPGEYRLYEQALPLHRSMEFALQIVLTHGAFEPGVYVKTKKYCRRCWERVSD